MRDILQMTLLGALAGMFAGFWTRIIKTDMIFRKFGRKLRKMNENHLMMFNEPSTVVKFIKCTYCLPVWICFVLSLWYIIEYGPCWTHCIIGVLGGLGAGNLVAELISFLRNEQ